MYTHLLQTLLCPQFIYIPPPPPQLSMTFVIETLKQLFQLILTTLPRTKQALLLPEQCVVDYLVVDSSDLRPLGFHKLLPPDSTPLLPQCQVGINHSTMATTMFSLATLIASHTGGNLREVVLPATLYRHKCCECQAR